MSIVDRASRMRDGLAERLAERRLRAPDPDTAAGIARLRQEVTAAEIAAATGAAEERWVAFQHQLRDDVLARDPRRFLRWEVIVETMFVRDAPWVGQELDALLAPSDHRWAALLDEIATGAPPGLQRRPSTSGNTVHHAYHLRRFTEATGVDIASLELVVEFGGGYGNLARLVHGLGFRGRYVIFDSPVFCALQRFYLAAVATEIGLPLEAVTCTADVEDVAAAIDGASSSLFVATWSLSESSAALQDRFVTLTAPCDAQLIAYQERFGDLDNVDTFGSWPAAHPDLQWQAEPIAHLPGNHYLFGHRQPGHSGR